MDTPAPQPGQGHDAAVGPALVLEAVLHTDQLADIRRMLATRLDRVGDDTLWEVVTATNELVTNALVHSGRCLGLRIYWDAPVVRIEVDDPSPVRLDPDRRGRGLRIVSDLASRWGDRLADPSPPGVLRRRGASPAKTVWCELRSDR